MTNNRRYMYNPAFEAGQESGQNNFAQFGRRRNDWRDYEIDAKLKRTSDKLDRVPAIT